MKKKDDRLSKILREKLAGEIIGRLDGLTVREMIDQLEFTRTLLSTIIRSLGLLDDSVILKNGESFVREHKDEKRGTPCPT